jgi:hypothetical protein
VKSGLKVDWWVVVLVVVAGVCLGLVTGFVENSYFRGVVIPEKRFYGFPLPWRSFDPFVGEGYFYFELFVDVVFWIAIVAVVALVIKKLMSRS